MLFPFACLLVHGVERMFGYVSAYRAFLKIQNLTGSDSPYTDGALQAMDEIMAKRNQDTPVSKWEPLRLSDPQEASNIPSPYECMQYIASTTQRLENSYKVIAIHLLENFVGNNQVSLKLQGLEPILQKRIQFVCRQRGWDVEWLVDHGDGGKSISILLRPITKKMIP